MKIYSFLLISLFFVSCGSPNYFLKQADQGDPHAVVYLKNGTTQISKINGKYPPEKASHFIRLKPGIHQIEVSHQAQQIGIFNSLLGLPGKQVSAQTSMQIDLAPGKTYRPACQIDSSGASFFLSDQSGLRSHLTRAAIQSY